MANRTSAQFHAGLSIAAFKSMVFFADIVLILRTPTLIMKMMRMAVAMMTALDGRGAFLCSLLLFPNTLLQSGFWEYVMLSAFVYIGDFVLLLAPWSSEDSSLGVTCIQI